MINEEFQDQDYTFVEKISLKKGLKHYRPEQTITDMELK